MSDMSPLQSKSGHDLNKARVCRVSELLCKPCSDLALPCPQADATCVRTSSYPSTSQRVGERVMVTIFELRDWSNRAYEAAAKSVDLKTKEQLSCLGDELAQKARELEAVRAALRRH
jgi:hypothetical protein